MEDDANDRLVTQERHSVPRLAVTQVDVDDESFGGYRE